MKKQFKTTKQNDVRLWINMLITGKYECLYNDAKFNTWLQHTLYEAIKPYKLNNQ